MQRSTSGGQGVLASVPGDAAPSQAKKVWDVRLLQVSPKIPATIKKNQGHLGFKYKGKLRSNPQRRRLHLAHVP